MFLHLKFRLFLSGPKQTANIDLVQYSVNKDMKVVIAKVLVYFNQFFKNNHFFLKVDKFIWISKKYGRMHYFRRRGMKF